MTAFRADLEALADLTGALIGFDTRADQAVAALDRSVQRLHARWDGDAASAHDAAHRRWLHTNNQLRAAADALRSLVGTAHDNYASAAAANLRMWA